MPCHSVICQGSSKEACTFQASSWWSSIPGILASSSHQPGILCACACQVTHLSYSSTGGSEEDLFLSSSSELPAGSWRKQLTSGPNSGGGSRSKSRRGSLAYSSSPDPGPHQGGLYSKKGAGLSGQTLWCLLFHPWDLLLWQSQLQGWAQMSSLPRVMDQLSLSIFSKVAVVARALWWASLASARSLSVEVPLPPPPGGFAPGRLDVCWTRLLQTSYWFALFLPKAVFQGEHYLGGQFLHLFQPPQWGPW